MDLARAAGHSSSLCRMLVPGAPLPQPDAPASLAALAAAALTKRLLQQLDSHGSAGADLAQAANGLTAQHAQQAACPVCLEVDASPRVCAAGCRHEVCAACARRLCTTVATTPVRCPLCRGIVHGWASVPAALASGEQPEVLYS